MSTGTGLAFGAAVRKSSVTKRSVSLAGHKTSVSLEDAFWNALRVMAQERGATLSDLVLEVEQSRDNANLSSALRLYVLEYYRARSEALMPAAAKLA